MGAVVATLTVTACDPPPLICTEELDGVQVGAGVTCRRNRAACQIYSSVNDPIGAMARLKLAVCPALIVCDVGEPEAGASVKSD